MDPKIPNDAAAHSQPLEVVAAPDDDERLYPDLVGRWDLLKFEEFDEDDDMPAQFNDTDEEEKEENIGMGVDEHEQGLRTYVWGSGAFSIKQANNQIMGSTEAAAPFKLLWQSKCHGKHKVFFWLLLNDKLSTPNLLRRFQLLLCIVCFAAMLHRRQ